MHEAQEGRNPETLSRRLEELARGADAREDAAGNVLIRKPAARGREKVRSVCVHCAAPTAGGSLGPGESACLATILALLEGRAIEHGPLEVLLTAGGGTRGGGAAKLDPGLLESRVLIDLGGGEESVLCVGGAGWRETAGVWKLEREEPRAGSVGVELRVSGLRGGDAGRDIDRGRANASKVLARALLRLQELGGRVSAIEGPGGSHEIPC
ncbi:MAG: hypothetical protein ACUVYA_09025, partial [Planctomycetota bacterium]